MAAPASVAHPRRLTRERALAIYERGLERCRANNWDEGLVDLAWVAQNDLQALPALGFSYLGFGMARYRGDVAKGIRLCRRAIRLEFYQPESYVNLARVCLLSKKYRREAADAVLDGLKIDPEHPDLLRLQSQLGVRRRPVLRFLSRGNMFNRLFGWLRHQFRPTPQPEKEEPAGGGKPRPR